MTTAMPAISSQHLMLWSIYIYQCRRVLSGTPLSLSTLMGFPVKPQMHELTRDN